VYLVDGSGNYLRGADCAFLTAPATSPLAEPAIYMLLVPHYLAKGLVPAGTVVTEDVDVPIGWVPTLAVDPQNDSAIWAYWHAGPRVGAEYSQDYYPFNALQSAAVHWQATGPAGTYQLTGAGASFGAKTNA
jgi:hypothetical protein